MRQLCVLLTNGAVLDYIDFEAYGTIRLCGWSARPNLPRCSVETLQGKVEPAATYRFIHEDAARFIRENPAKFIHEDAAAATGVEELFVGFSIDFRLNGQLAQRIVFEDSVIFVSEQTAMMVVSGKPDYGSLLFESDAVLHREQIYCEGPPGDQVDPEILKFALKLRPPILDFGCGNGALVRAYRRAGIEAFGIELERNPIKESIQPDVAPFITLYDGRFPLPFYDGQFESVIASEVIEHVPDYATALAEIARVSRSMFAITVPDMSCIPIGHRRGYIPWHLLEATHVNFFHHRSLKKALAPYFRSIQLFQIARGELEGSFMPGSLAAIATK